MDGLEAVEISLSEVRKDNSDFRINSDMYKKCYLKNSVNKYDYLPIKGFANVSDGDHSKFPETQKQEVLYLQAKDIKNGFLNITSPVYVSNDYFNKNKRSLIKENDVILSIMGNVGDIALVPRGFVSCMANRAIAIIKDITIMRPAFLFIYLMTSYGFKEIERQKNGGVQERINLDVLGKIKIPELSSEFQNTIEKIVFETHDLIDSSKSLYTSAQNLLLSHLRILNYTFTNNSIAIKTFANSFGVSGRLDSEYYQPKYDEIENIINNYYNKTEPLKIACNLYDNNFNPLENQEYKYIELSNIGNYGEILNTEKYIGKKLPTRARRKIKTNQVIVSSIEGSLESCALVTEDFNNALCSTGFYVIDSDKVNSETLLMLFKSLPIQNMLKQRCSGTILTAINKSEFLSVPIPIIEDTIQQQIAQKVQESFTLRKKSTVFLEIAKKAVEMAIEEGEDVSLKWLLNKINEI